MNWDEWLLANEAAVRLTFFFGILFIMAVWEVLSPRRVLSLPRHERWTSNLALLVLNTVLLRLAFPAAAAGAAVLAGSNGWGLFNYYDVYYGLAVVFTVILLDLVIYLQHVMFHAVPVFWRLHRVHHADLDYDVTTGVRFHPVEILLSMLIKFAAIFLLGPPVAGVLIFEVLLNGTSMFNHGNVTLPRGLDRLLRLVIVTPDMHRVHHSVEVDETNSNFGFNLSWWDRLFATYRDQPRAGHRGMIIGIDHYRDAAQVDRLAGMLALPFVGHVEDYAINRRSWKGRVDE